MNFSNIWGTYSKIDVKHPKISKQTVTQYSFCLVAIDYYLKFCANIYHQKILNFWRHRETYTYTKWLQNWKWPLAEGESGEKTFPLRNDCQSNTKTIRIILRPEPSGDLVVKGKLFPRSGSVALRQLNPIHKKRSQSF